MQYAGAFLQLYREEAWYLERTVHYLARVGMDYIKKTMIEDAERREELYQRLLFSLEGEADPWHEPEKAQVDLRQFERISSSHVLTSN